jgi:hypothetical protein
LLLRVLKMKALVCSSALLLTFGGADMSEAILDRIQKLLALANDKAATENEAATAMRMAMGLMARHNIEETQIIERNKPATTQREIKLEREWWVNVCAAAAELYSCRYLIYANESIRFIGDPVNTEAAFMTATWLADQVERLYSANLPPGMTQSERAKYRRTFKFACAVRVRLRARELMKDIRENEAAAQSATGSTALVVASMMDQQLALADDFLAQKYPNLRTKKSKPRKLGPGTRAGYAAGEHVNLRRNVS